jgi:hypothetical protein
VASDGAEDFRKGTVIELADPADNKSAESILERLENEFCRISVFIHDFVYDL